MEEAINIENVNIHPALCYGFAEPSQEVTAEMIQSFVKEGKIVGEWSEQFKIHTNLSKNKDRLSLFEEAGVTLSDEFLVPDIQDLWQALEVFSGGSLDVLVLGNKLLELTDTQQDLMLELSNWALKVQQSIDAGELSSLEVPDFEEKSGEDPYLLNQVGKLFVLIEDYGKAGRCFRQAIELQRNFSEPYTNMGALMWQLGDQKEAFELFVESLLKNPNHSTSQLNFFDAAYELEEYELVIKVIDSCLMHLTNKTEFFLHKAICCQKLGRVEEAIGLLEDILLENPKDEEARDLLDKFRQES